MRKWYYINHRLKWDNEYWQKIGERMADAIFTFRLPTAGRILWSIGSETMYRHGAQAASNCSFVEVKQLSRDAAWGMNVLMLGSGLGATTYDLESTIQRPRDEIEIYDIPDSRQGWVESVRRLIASYEEGSNTIQFNYDFIRPLGSPIRGFGGVASGPAPLQELHERIRGYLDAHVAHMTSNTRLVADVINAIGACVVAGNVRRSAQILLGQPDDDEFINLKDWTLYPERSGIMHLSNNTAVLRSDNEYENYQHIPRIAERMLDKGEPGLLSLHNIQTYGRYGEKLPDLATGTNPCAEICLESFENCVISDVAPAKCVDEYGNFSPALFYEALRLATLITSTIVLIPTESELTNAVIGRNRRIGVSLTGIADWWAIHPTSRIISWLNKGYDVVREENTRLAKEAGVPASVRVTTVKPSGTVSLLAGVSSGIHAPSYSRYWRRIRIGKTSPVLPILIEAGVPVEDDVTAPNDTAVLTFGVDQGKVRGAKDISMFEKFSHVKILQKFFADNSVSVTVTYDPEREASSLEHGLAQTIPWVKTLSVLPLDNNAYPQMPEEQTTLENINKWKKQVKDIDWSKFSGSDGNALTDAYCSNDSCTV
jgi:ribonucleoside-triphosphate reductase